MVVLNWGEKKWGFEEEKGEINWEKVWMMVVNDFLLSERRRACSCKCILPPSSVFLSTKYDQSLTRVMILNQ